MNNTILWILMLSVNFAMIMASFRFGGKTGLYVWMVISCIVSNIQVTKTILVFGMEATLGNIAYATGFLATDILAEFYGKKDADRAVYIGLFSIICATVLMRLAIMFTPSPSDTVSSSLTEIFGLMPRIAGASLLAYFVSNMHDVWAFLFWKKKTKGKHLWLRNNLSTMVSQIIDSVIFNVVAFAGVFGSKQLYQIILTTYIIKAMVAVLDTSMMYLSRKWVKENKIPDIKP